MRYTSRIPVIPKDPAQANPEGLEQCLPWHKRARGGISRGNTWLHSLMKGRSLPVTGTSDLKIVEDWLLAFRPAYLVLRYLRLTYAIGKRIPTSASSPMRYTSRIPIIPRDRAQATPLGWNNARRGMTERGTISYVARLGCGPNCYRRSTPQRATS